ncbi:putative Cinnamoyl-CoA reductase [Zostera marina]|uniref:Putative Cinnamoyl-CoA reductase n=1 Tax=Zostera marina TaxID=29655 RepID=A0A0K9P0L9_ZOSMR|nr:putative Cinnamoyl-CoA reductase [Zostera marina]
MEGVKGTVCVVGAGGYIASWTVKLLLSGGYKVHGTVRDPTDEKKNSHLIKMDKAGENLQLFKADVLDYDSLLQAIKGCDGVIHAASPVIPPMFIKDPVKQVIEPTVVGTENVLKAALEAKVKRVVMVSSTATVIQNPNWKKDVIMNEEYWSDKEYCRQIEDWYCLAKTTAEEEAWKFSKETGLDIVTVLPTMTVGPLLQPTVNGSSLWLVHMIKGTMGQEEDAVRGLVDVRDVATALLLTYEKPEAKGRYLCTAVNLRIPDIVNKLKAKYPEYKYPQSYTDAKLRDECSGEKLKGLGWECRGIDEILTDSVEFYKKSGLLD